ncbi:AMP-binding protein, partial [Pseudoalteromonas luteoviolacea]
MINVPQLVESFVERDILITAREGELKIKAPQGAVCEQDLQLIRTHKAELLSWLSAQQDNDAGQVEIVRHQYAENAVPLSYSQQSLWLVEQLNEHNATYNMTSEMHIAGQFDCDIAQQAFTDIIVRHQILRTVYRQHDEQIYQQVQDTFSFQIDTQDLSDHSGSARADAVTELLAAYRTRPFDLNKDLMLRVLYIKLSTDEGVLAINMHHIASDGWSTDILLAEFCQNYETRQTTGVCAGDELDIQYADYACWQRQRLSDNALQGKLDYWRQQLAELQPLHPLMLDFDRPEVKQSKGQRVQGRIDIDVAGGLQRLARALNLTPFMLFHAAFALLVARHGNSQDITIGTPVANREHPELSRLIGFFVNPLVLRVSTEHTTVAEYLEHVKQVNLAALANQEVPFELLVKELNTQRDRSYTPLFQLVLTCSNDFGVLSSEGREALTLPGLSVTPIEAEEAMVKSDIELDIRFDKQGAALSWVYDPALFTATRITELNAQLSCVLAQLAALDGNTVELGLNTLSLFSPLQGRKIDQLLAGEQEDYDTELCIHELIEQHAELTPDAIAVQCDDSQLSYAQLNQNANQLAHYLRQEYDVKPGSLVGLCLSRSVNMVVALLAVLKAGGAYVPIDPSYPSDRIDYMLRDAAPQVVLSEPDIWQALKTDFAYQSLSTVPLAAYSNENLAKTELELTSSHLAYVIYTSGSTGKPKGVMISHQSLHHSTRCRNNTYDGLQAFMLVSSFSFDSSVAGVFSALTSGARLCIASVALQNDAEQFITQLEHWQITHFSAVPGFYGVLLDCLNERGAPARLSLKGIVVAGEECAPSLVDKHYQYFAGQPVGLFNEYGPTEATVWATVERLQPAQPITIGRAIANCQLYILTADGAQAPLGSVGE